MNASQVAQVANFLNVSPNQIKRCEEWAFVLFVQVRGYRPRFVSKKVIKIMEMTRKQLAEKIKSEIDCTAKVWIKDDKVRVYLSHRGKDYGFVAITSKGIEFALTGYGKNAYGSTIKNTSKGIVISEPQEIVAGVRRLTQSEVDELAISPRKDYRDDTAKALDAMYGRGGWDRWDREDYEG